MSRDMTRDQSMNSTQRLIRTELRELKDKLLKDLDPIPGSEHTPKVNQRWLKPLRNLEPLKKLGTGSYGEVWKVLRHDMEDFNSKPGEEPNAIFAAKIIRIRRPLDSDDIKVTSGLRENTEEKRNEAVDETADEKMAKDEAQLVMSLRHKHIVKCYGAFQNKHNLVFIYEYASGGDVHDRLEIFSEGLPEEEARSIVGQVLDALKYLHSKEITHRDIKPENIYYKYARDDFHKGDPEKFKNRDKNLVFLGDFGLSIRPNWRVIAEFAGSEFHAAPEIMHASKYNEKVDIWSLGITAYELLKGYYPHEHMGYAHVFDREGNCLYTDENIEDVVTENFHGMLDVQNFLKKCLAIRPETRFSAKEALDHEWLIPRKTGVSNVRNNAGRIGIGKDFNARKEWQKTIRALQQTHISPNTDSQNDQQPRSQVKRMTNAGKSWEKGNEDIARAGSDSKIKRGGK